MKKIGLYILLFSILQPCMAQNYRSNNLKNTQWRKLAYKFSKQRNMSEVVANLQSLISSAKSSSKFGVAIYYELLLGQEFEKTNEFGLAEETFTHAYEETKTHLPAKHKKYYLLSQQFQATYFDPIDRLGYFYLTIGNLKHAEQLFEESKILRDNFFSPHSVHRVYPVIGLGSYYFRKGEYDKT